MTEEHKHSHGHSHGNTVIHDPVCGMTVNVTEDTDRFEYAGEDYYFCSSRCLGKFSKEPENYLGERPEPEEMPAGTLYTCPMHPDNSGSLWRLSEMRNGA